MIPRECKRLAEVDFPIAEVSRHSVREKYVRRGHPSSVHKWWAQRPLAACRCVLLGLLWPDPCDPACPPSFKDEARRLLRQIPNCRPLEDDESLRRSLVTFIADFASWELAINPEYLRVARALVAAAHGDGVPLLVDPFAGAGSIPLEALRVGCDAYASDINPVACTIMRVLLDVIPRHGPDLSEDLRRVGEKIERSATRELCTLYPKDPDGGKPVAYLWARTVRCEAAKCGAEIPLMRSYWLSNTARSKIALRPCRQNEDVTVSAPQVAFELFEPKRSADVHPANVAHAKATCLCCGTVLMPSRVRAQLSAQRGGADVVFDERGQRIGGARLMAVIVVHGSQPTLRRYRLPTDHDYETVRMAQAQLTSILVDWQNGKGGGGDLSCSR